MMRGVVTNPSLLWCDVRSYGVVWCGVVCVAVRWREGVEVLGGRVGVRKEVKCQK